MQTALSDPREAPGLLCLCSVSVSATDAGGSFCVGSALKTGYVAGSPHARAVTRPVRRRAFSLRAGWLGTHPGVSRCGGSRRRRWTAVASPWPENPEPAFRALAPSAGARSISAAAVDLCLGLRCFVGTKTAPFEAPGPTRLDSRAETWEIVPRSTQPEV